ncbi:MAG: hypothetical protein HY721_26055 [Planctomycetes bacterium]|nr:hypothetical protein [Planctomycetota bacterium]
MTAVDWEWKLAEAIERLRSRYAHIGRKTGAPFLAIVYPPEAEAAVLREWRTRASSLTPELEVRTIDVLEVTMAVVEELGCESIVSSFKTPMPGSDPEADLGQMWAATLAARVTEATRVGGRGKVVVVLERLGALHPATTPRAVLQRLWDSEQSALEGPVVVLIPGTLKEPRVYSFLDQREELMYRGDIL